MFIGHFAAGMGAKAAAPGVSLGTLFLAFQFVDLLWPTLLLLGIEHVRIAPGITAVTPLDFVDYPVSHSLLAVCGWGILLGGLYRVARKSLRGALVVGLGVVSHWVLDLVMHRPDLPLWPGGSVRLGLGLWDSLAGTLVVEGVVFAVGVVLYLRVTEAKGRAGVYGFWSLVAVLALIHLGNLFGPPPPGTEAIAWAGQLQWLFVGWGYWLDRHRTATNA